MARSEQRVRGRQPRRVEGVSCCPSRSPAPLASSLAGVCRSARGARGGLGSRPSRKGVGGGQVNRSDSLRGATLNQLSKLGRGIRWECWRRTDKQGGALVSGRPLPPSHPATQPARALPQRPTPPLPRTRRPPGPQAPRVGPAQLSSARKVPGRPPSPGCSSCSEIRGAAHLGPPRATARAGRLPLGRLASGLQLPRPCPPTRRGPRPRSAPAARPPAEDRFAPTWPANPPSPGHCAHVRGRGHNPVRIPRQGRERRSAPACQRASERARLGTHPPRRLPRFAPPTGPRHGARAACTPESSARTPRWLGIHTPSRL